MTDAVPIVDPAIVAPGAPAPVPPGPGTAPAPVVPPVSQGTVVVQDKLGNLTEVPAAALANLPPEHFAPATPEQTALFRAKQEQTGPAAAAKAFAEAGLGTATFGLSDVLERALDISDPLSRQARSQTQPLATAAGDVAGFLIPGAAEKALAGAGYHGLAKIAAGAPGLAADLGETAATGARALLPDATSLAGRIGTDVATSGALGNAVHGAALGLGQSVTEDAFDPDLTAEHALARGGADALLGAGVGGLIGAPLGLVSSAAKELAPRLVPWAKNLENSTFLNALGVPTAAENRSGARQSKPGEESPRQRFPGVLHHAGGARPEGSRGHRCRRVGRGPAHRPSGGAALRPG